jgi:protein-disulfide isomerase
MHIMRLAFALTALLALAACGGSGAPAASSTAVAAVPAPSGKAWTDIVARTPEGGYRQGNPDAPIELVEYGSRNCPACGRFAAEGVEPLRAKYIASGRVSYEFRDFLIHGAPDLAAALLNQCVPAEAFFTMLDQLFANQGGFLDRTQALVSGDPQRARQLQAFPPAQAAAGFADAIGYVEFIKQQGVPEARARACLADAKAIESISKVNADAVNSGIGRTPTFMINGRVLRNAGSWAELEPELRAAGAR